MSHFESYGRSETGRQLSEIVSMSEMIAEYVAMSRIGKPAVQAIASDVAEVIEGLPGKTERDLANQFVGWQVGQIMRGLGYKIINKRGRVNNAPFKTGAVWSSKPDVEVRRSPIEGVPRRIEVKVSVEVDGHAVASIDAVDVARDRIGKVRHILHHNIPAQEALEKAKTYAERHGYRYVHVLGEVHALSVKD
ncbi:hypothetical protein [Paracoccus sp. 228]|uniref:hypothetical protein n=1 Tax=Paracoccus sp. 228 TaxID=1192054 RepID=UPI000B095F14|nr:hypothetical protein [Paracoccus sp. 228]